MVSEVLLPRVMVVDDEPMVRQFVSSVLTTSGYSVSDADSPDRALSLMDANPDIDLLVTDVVMPGGNGWDLANKMRSHKPDLRVLFISGYEPPNGKTVPKSSFLQKPFRIAELLDRVRQMLAPERATSCSSAPPVVAGMPNPRK